MLELMSRHNSGSRVATALMLSLDDYVRNQTRVEVGDEAQIGHHPSVAAPLHGESVLHLVIK
jgi:hypothetical protein